MVAKRPFYEFATRDDSHWLVSLRRIGCYLWVTISHEDFAGGTWEDAFLVADGDLETALTDPPIHEDGRARVQTIVHRSCSFTSGWNGAAAAYDYTHAETLVLPATASEPFQFLKEAVKKHFANLPEEAGQVKDTERLCDQDFMRRTAGRYTPASFIEMFTVWIPQPDHEKIRIDFKTGENFQTAYISIIMLILWLLQADRQHRSNHSREQCEVLIELEGAENTFIGLDPRVIGTLKQTLLS